MPSVPKPGISLSVQKTAQQHDSTSCIQWIAVGCALLIKRIMYVLEWRTVSAHERVINKYQNNTRVSAETVCHESVYIILFLTRHYKSINDDKMTIFTHRPRGSLAQSSYCWWRRNRLLMTSQWLDNCDAIAWIVISNSLDIDYIHGDIHDGSCKKATYAILYWYTYMWLCQQGVYVCCSCYQIHLQRAFTSLLEWTYEV